MATIAEKTLDANGNVAVRITARSDSNLSEHTVDGNGLPAVRVATTNIKNLNEHTVDENGAPALRVICEDGSVGGGGTPATKFGVSIDNLLGNVDANGAYVAPVGDIVLDLTGVSALNYDSGFQYKLTHTQGNIKIIANDVQSVSGYAFQNCCQYSKGDTLEIYCDSITEITNGLPFQSTLKEVEYKNIIISFASLERIADGYVFQNFIGSTNNSTAILNFDTIFPKLKYIEGTAVFTGFCPGRLLENGRITLSKVETIVGAATHSNSTFAYISADIYLPACTRVENYICRTGNTNTIHFAAANQAAIEACPGYENKFGADEIYFDL